MNNIVNVADIIEENGKTVRENNQNKKHSIPIGSLVEIKPDTGPDHEGIRLFVVDYTRDCDGTPLYSLSFNKDAKTKMEKYKKELSILPYGNDFEVTKIMYFREEGSIIFGYSESSLIFIK